MRVQFFSHVLLLEKDDVSMFFFGGQREDASMLHPSFGVEGG